MLETMHTEPVPMQIDDCWNRIGIRGDGSCDKLAQHFRCLNCPTYAAGAIALLDRRTTEFVSATQWQSTDVVSQDTRSVLLFRVGAEWLALPPDAINEVAEINTIHSLPHQSNHAVLGLTNIRGVLVLCISLSAMLHAQPADQLQKNPRLLVVTHAGQKLVFPVDDVYGIHRFQADQLQTVPTTLAHAGARFTHAVLQWKDHTVGLLDCELLCYALNRSLT